MEKTLTEDTMNGGTVFFIFLGALVLAIFGIMADFNMFLIAGGIILITAIIVFIFSVQARSYTSAGIRVIGEDNNYRFYFLCFCCLVVFFIALKYGTGEPLFLDTLRQTEQIVVPDENLGRQKTLNGILVGREVSNMQLDNTKDYLSTHVASKYPRKERLATESKETYNERIQNQFAYSIFATNVELNNELRLIPYNYTAKEPEASKKTWFFWKLLFVLVMLTALYGPFAFRDEAVSLLEKAKDAFERNREHYKSSLVPITTTVSSGSTAGTATVAGPAAGIGDRLGFMAKLYSSDMAAEFTIKLLEGAIKALKR
jgi:hypothetical protein